MQNLTITISGPAKSGKTHLALKIAKLLRESNVQYQLTDIDGLDGIVLVNNNLVVGEDNEFRVNSVMESIDFHTNTPTNEVDIDSYVNITTHHTEH